MNSTRKTKNKELPNFHNLSFHGSREETNLKIVSYEYQHNRNICNGIYTVNIFFQRRLTSAVLEGFVHTHEDTRKKF